MLAGDTGNTTDSATLLGAPLINSPALTASLVRLLDVSPTGLSPMCNELIYSRRPCKKFESVNDHAEDYCRNYGRNLVHYVATLNYLRVVILVLSGKRPVTV